MEEISINPRHTRSCDEARLCGHPKARCICTETERLHEDWEALDAMYRIAARYTPAKHPTLYKLARAKTALREQHDSIAEQLREEKGQEYPGCPACIAQEGP